MDPFFLETIKNPLSVSMLVIVYLLLLIIVTISLLKEMIQSYLLKGNLCSNGLNIQRLVLFLVAVGLYLLSSGLVFYNSVKMPPAGYEDDDGIYVIGAYILKNSGHDSVDKKSIPYFPMSYVNYHREKIGGAGLRAVPVYFQVFLQYFIQPGKFSLKFENALFIFFSSLLVFFSFFIITSDLDASLVCGALFNVVPWARFLSNVHPEASAYCFGSASFLFGLLYLIRKKNMISCFFYLTCVVMLFFSWSPGILLVFLCVIFLPIVLISYSNTYKSLAINMTLLTVFLMSILYFDYYNESGYQWNLSRPASLGCVEGLADFDIKKVCTGLIDNAHIYSANYLGYLSPQFLFFSGDANPRHNSGIGGQLFPALFLAFYFGLFYLIWMQKKDLNFKLLLTYLLLSIFPYSICLEGSLNVETKLPLHALRQAAMLPPVAIITTLGLTKVLSKNRTVFFLYLVLIIVNIFVFYVDYFNDYPKRLGNVWFNDPGLEKVSVVAYDKLKEKPGINLFYHASYTTFAYHNLNKIKTEELLNGDGILSNVYGYYSKQDVDPKSGDLFIVQEPFDYNSLKKSYRFIERFRNKYLLNNDYGASLFEIVE